MKYLVIILLLTACQKEPDYCYECHNESMHSMTYCGYTESDMQAVREWWECYGDTLNCKIIEP